MLVKQRKQELQPGLKWSASVLSSSMMLQNTPHCHHFLLGNRTGSAAGLCPSLLFSSWWYGWWEHTPPNYFVRFGLVFSNTGVWSDVNAPDSAFSFIILALLLIFCFAHHSYCFHPGRRCTQRGATGWLLPCQRQEQLSLGCTVVLADILTNM